MFARLGTGFESKSPLVFTEQGDFDLEQVDLHLLPKDGDRVLQELSDGNMVIVRSKNDFLYILEFDGQYHMFSHVPGAPGGGQKQFPKDEKYIAVVKKLADIADGVYKATFDKGMNLYGVMAAAEEGILSMFPGEMGEDDVIEFILPGEMESDEDKTDLS